MGKFFATYWMQISILAALAFGVWYIDHRGYERAEDHYKKQEAQAQIRAEALARQIEQTLTTKLGELDTRTAERLSQIDVEQRTVVMPTLTREIRNDPRLSDPANRLSDGVFNAVNSARAASANPAAPSEH